MSQRRSQLQMQRAQALDEAIEQREIAIQTWQMNRSSKASEVCSHWTDEEMRGMQQRQTELRNEKLRVNTLAPASLLEEQKKQFVSGLAVKKRFVSGLVGKRISVHQTSGQSRQFSGQSRQLAWDEGLVQASLQGSERLGQHDAARGSMGSRSQTRRLGQLALPGCRSSFPGAAGHSRISVKFEDFGQIRAGSTSSRSSVSMADPWRRPSAWSSRLAHEIARPKRTAADLPSTPSWIGVRVLRDLSLPSSSLPNIVPVAPSSRPSERRRVRQLSRPGGSLPSLMPMVPSSRPPERRLELLELADEVNLLIFDVLRR